MQISFVGLLICAGILVIGYYCHAPLIIGLIVSLAFGATAVMTLSAIGGSSPLIYTFFAALLITAVVSRRRMWRDLGHVFGKIRPVWVLTGLMLYAMVGAWLFPRFFAGQTSVFVQAAMRRGVIEAPLAPVSGNITQTGYFVLGGLTAIALCVLLLHENRLESIRRGFLLWCSVHVVFGLLDLLGKVAGAGDILSPIRTASYAMLTEVIENGFWRITGAASEASSFGGGSLVCLSFCYVYWRKTKSRVAQALAFLLLVLLLLSTSSVAYVGLAVLSIPVALSISWSFLSGRMDKDEILIIALLALAAVTVLAIVQYDEEFFAPFVHLIDSMVLNKASSASGQERAYWNIKSLQAFVETGGSRRRLGQFACLELADCGGFAAWPSWRGYDGDAVAGYTQGHGKPKGAHRPRNKCGGIERASLRAGFRRRWIFGCWECRSGHDFLHCSCRDLNEQSECPQKQRCHNSHHTAWSA